MRLVTAHSASCFTRGSSLFRMFNNYTGTSTQRHETLEIKTMHGKKRTETQ